MVKILVKILNLYSKSILLSFLIKSMIFLSNRIIMPSFMELYTHKPCEECKIKIEAYLNKEIPENRYAMD